MTRGVGREAATMVDEKWQVERRNSGTSGIESRNDE